MVKKLLRKTIKSVANQSFNNLEHIIIDGKSSDKTLKKVYKYKKNLSLIVSEKDKGIYDAFNKGMKLNTGKFVVFVNCGDTLRKNGLKIIFKYLSKYNKLDLFFGSVKKHLNCSRFGRKKSIIVGDFIQVTLLDFYKKNNSAQKSWIIQFKI